MKTYEVLKKSIQGDYVDHAKALRLSTSTLHKWTEPTVDFSDSGALNPLDRVETIIATSQALGHAPESALAPIQYLATRFGGVYIPSIHTSNSLGELSQHVFASLKAFGELMQQVGSATSPASESGVKISPNERKRIHGAGFEAVQLITALLAAVEQEAA